MTNQGEPVPVLVGDSEVSRYARRLEQELEETREALRRERESKWSTGGAMTTEEGNVLRLANAALRTSLEEARQERDALRAAVDEWSETAGKRRTERNEARQERDAAVAAKEEAEAVAWDWESGEAWIRQKARIGELEAALREAVRYLGTSESEQDQVVADKLDRALER